MAFNFMSGQQQYDPFSPYQQSFYNDPRRRGAQGSFNPYALSNFAATSAKGGMTPPMDATKPPVNMGKPPSPFPQAPTVPNPTQPPNPAYSSQPNPTQPPSSTYYTQPGTPPPSTPGYQAGGTAAPKPGQQGSGFDYAAYPTLQALYASHPGGLPVGFDMDAWAQATGNQSVMNQSTSGDPLRFTWNPNEPGFINPQTGETYDKPGETYPAPPPPPRAPSYQPGGARGDFLSLLLGR